MIDGLETCALPSERRDALLIDFCHLVDYFHKAKVNLVKEEGIESHVFSFGHLWEFLFGNRDYFVSKESLKGIEQTTHQMLSSTLMQHPALGGEITADEWAATTLPKTSYGLFPYEDKDNYVADTDAWHRYRAAYYAANQTDYVWDISDDPFLPNLPYSNGILEGEILKHGLGQEYECEKARLGDKALHVFFHDKIMRGKGHDLAAYTELIGNKICEANFYHLEPELSRREYRLANSLRRIYSLINREGRKQYISLDFRHGMMEYHNEFGEHLGEYRFTGHLNSAADITHNLRGL
mgnify:FL=1